MAGCWLLAAGTGCESLQKKFTRKPKTTVRPSPIIQFQDYTRAMTPLDRYRKHYAIFDYWNSQLLDELKPKAANPKRLQKASSEALNELQLLRGLLQEDRALRLDGLIERRQRLSRQLRSGSYASSQFPILREELERQTRDMHRDFFWRKVQDALKQPEEALGAASPAASQAPEDARTH